jgi:DNA-binding response OmpR family regulator
MSLVLVVEDDPAILQGLHASLRVEGHDVLSASDGDAGYRLACEKTPELVILDLMLPKMSGFEICRKLRAERFSAPILMLTARGEESDRVLGLDLGADDYMIKPFSVRELLARVRALLRRTADATRMEKLPDEIRFDDVIVDFRSCEASKRGAALALTRKEFGLLRALAANAGHVVSRDDLLNSVWGYEALPTTRTVDTHIALLRAKIEGDPAEPRRLITVHGIGYKLVLTQGDTRDPHRGD